MCEDKGMVMQLKSDSKLAFTMIYMKYHKMMYGFSYKYLFDQYWAEDTVQWLFLKLWENRQALDEELNLKSYLFTSLKNHLLNELRNQSRAIKHSEFYMSESDDSEMNPVEQALQEEDVRKALDKAMLRLSPQKRLICELKIKEELSNTEIAERLHLSVNTVKFQYNQIIKELRGQIDPRLLFAFVIFLCL